VLAQEDILMVERLNQWFYNFTSWRRHSEMKEHLRKRLFFTVIGFF